MSASLGGSSGGFTVDDGSDPGRPITYWLSLYGPAQYAPAAGMQTTASRRFFGNCPYGHLGRHCWHPLGGGRKRCCCCEKVS